MRANFEQYLSHLLALLPQGWVWPRDPDSTLGRLLAGFAGALRRAHQRALELIEEADPRTTFELLGDWERVCGLPDACSAHLAGTLQERRAAVVAKLNERGGQSIEYFISVGARFGYDITITEFRPFTCDYSRSDDRTYDDLSRHFWRVNAPVGFVSYFRAAQSTAGEPLVSASNDPLQCIFEQLKPAHSHVLYNFNEVT